jgi:hypothetical protein
MPMGKKTLHIVGEIFFLRRILYRNSRNLNLDIKNRESIDFCPMPHFMYHLQTHFHISWNWVEVQCKYWMELNWPQITKLSKQAGNEWNEMENYSIVQDKWDNVYEILNKL